MLFHWLSWDEIKLIDSNASFLEFHFFETMYTQFHLDETPLLSLFINYLPCHQKILCGNSFIENETPIKSSLRTGQLYHICKKQSASSVWLFINSVLQALKCTIFLKDTCRCRTSVIFIWFLYDTNKNFKFHLASMTTWFINSCCYKPL
jgi:hypothetical protein